MKEAIEHGADDLRFSCRGVCFLHLTEKLRFADDERVEAGCDAKQVAGAVEIGEVIEMRRKIAGVKSVEISQKGGEIRLRAGEILVRRIHLGAVARRHDHRLACEGACRNRLECAIDAARLKVDTLAQLDRRGAMADSDEKEVHSSEIVTL